MHVLVPYRGREEHLKCFVEEFVPCLKKHVANVKITIIEQSDDGKLFNRGKLLNVGVREAGEDSTHFVLQDVDTLASDSCVKRLYNVQKNEEEIIRIRAPHSTSLGCICRVSSEAMHKINGFPNGLYGWGIEDRALYWRAKIKEIPMSMNYSVKHSFRELDHKSNAIKYTGEKLLQSDRWKQASIRKLNHDQKEDLVQSDGLNNVEYRVLQKKRIKNGVEVITVKI